MNITGTILKELRVKKNITLEQLSTELNEKFNVNLTRSMLSRWETGKSIPVYDHLKRLALYYEVTTDFLLGFNHYKDLITNNLDAPLDSTNKGIRNPKKRSTIESLTKLFEDDDFTNKDLLLIKDIAYVIKARKHKDTEK